MSVAPSVAPLLIGSLFYRKLEFTQNLIDQKIDDLAEESRKKLSREINNIQGAIYASKIQEDHLKDKLRVLEDHNRRNNLKIDGIRESVNETWDECEEKVKKFLKEVMKIEDDIKIERTHRMGKTPRLDKRPRTVIFKLASWKDKELILKNRKNLKGTGYYINEDFSDETLAIRRNLFKEMKRHRQEGKYCIVTYDKLVIRDNREYPQNQFQRNNGTFQINGQQNEIRDNSLQNQNTE